MKYIKTLYLSICCTFVLGACSNDDASNITDLVLGNPVVSNVTYNEATLSSTLTGRSPSIIKKGFCYSTETNPDVYSSIIEIRDTNLSAHLSGLLRNTTYHVRAFVTLLNKEPIYSSETSFTTPAETEEELLVDYEAPAYLDNYTSITDWNMRSQWNLSNVHDPSVIKADDGYYYMYQTDASYGNAHSGHGHFHARRSKDLVNWEYIGATMENAPAWIKTKLNEYRTEMGLDPIEDPSYGYWAPVVRKVANGKYRMYYSIVINNYIKTGKANIKENFDNSWTERAFIGLMETADPAGNIWEDKGFVISSASDKNLNDWTRTSRTDDWDAYFKINAIDPTYIITPEGEHWLIYGSWHSGIAALQLNAETGKPLNEPGKPWNISGEDNSGYGKIIFRRGDSRWQGSEGPEIIYRNGFYYLFMAYDALEVPYNTRVVRSTHITGPYVGNDGTDVTHTGEEAFPIITHPYKFNNSEGWVGVSHCAVFDDGNGNWFFASQGRFPKDLPGINASNAIMMGHIRSIRWTDKDWPVVMPERYGAVPQAKISESELIGNWEHIDLSYHYGKQRTSSTLTLTTDHKTSGVWDGTWSYNSNEQTITLNNGVILYLQRETDWEATPRTHTIVYAAHGVKETYWGKKVH